MSERLLWIPRTVLFVPRWVLWGAAQPVRAGAYAFDRYNLQGRYLGAFFNRKESFGIYPALGYDTDYGVSAGVRLSHYNAVGVRMRLELAEERRTIAAAHFRSGETLQPFELELELDYRNLNEEPYYGIGDGANADKLEFHEEWKRVGSAIDYAIVDPLTVRLVGALAAREFDDMRTRTVGFETQLVYDSRRPSESYANPINDATGWRASIAAGKTVGFGDDMSDFRTYSAEVQRFFDLYHGTRVLALRALLDGVDGEASILDLPRLGGSDLLRGYGRGRFRDKVATLVSAEYGWELGNYLGAYTFVDVGRVWPALSAIAVAKPRVGYGGGLQLSGGSYVARVQLAASQERDIGVSLLIATTFPSRKRLGRP